MEQTHQDKIIGCRTSREDRPGVCFPVYRFAKSLIALIQKKHWVRFYVHFSDYFLNKLCLECEPAEQNFMAMASLFTSRLSEMNKLLMRNLKEDNDNLDSDNPKKLSKFLYSSAAPLRSLEKLLSWAVNK